MRTSDMLLAAIVIAALAIPLDVRAGAADDEVCKTAGPCRTKSIVREAGSAKFVLFGGFTFEPLSSWTTRAIYETSDGDLVRFEYERPDRSVACGLSLFHFAKGPPDLDFAWFMFIGDDLEKGNATLIAEEHGDGYRRSAIVKYREGTTYQIEMRRFDEVQTGLLYALAQVSVAPSTTAISSTDADVVACRVKPPPV